MFLHPSCLLNDWNSATSVNHIEAAGTTRSLESPVADGDEGQNEYCASIIWFGNLIDVPAGA
jgi:hypothetical protein